MALEPMDLNFTSPTASTTSEYTCGTDLEVFHNRYAQVHGWVSLLVCMFGSVANSLNIAVLTRREMRSPTNMILTGLAIADLLVMIEYMPYACHLYLYHRSRRDTFTYGWAVFVLFHSNFEQVCHTISIWLTVTLAIWRYIAVAHPQRNREWCSYRRTVFAIAGAYVFCPILCVPLYITTEVRPHVETLDQYGMSVNLTAGDGTLEGATNTTLYFVKLTETARVHSALKEMNFWIYSVVIKLIPCLLLTVLSIRLIRVLIEAKRRRKKLRSNVTPNTVDTKETEARENGRKKKRIAKALDKEKQTDRTTMMLLAVLLLFLITELPQGVLGLLSVIIGPSFFHTCYIMLGDVIDILTLINSAINFILYCLMSRQFRMTFHHLFCSSRWAICGGWWIHVPHHPIENNGNTATNQTMTQVTQV
ncbi:hypothetical protein KM043_009732 [Ampulex compressa]|nr:hypothetical protein KM043_009732 [Ampulex compressa]